MIHQLAKEYQGLSRDVHALAYILIFLMSVVIARIIYLMLERQYDQIWPLFSTLIPLVAALVAVRVANRLIVNSHLMHENDRRLEVVRITHHLMVVSRDLLDRVRYVKHMLCRGSYSALAFSRTADGIENRYEVFFERDVYKVLPGNCAQILASMSPSIFGIGVLAEGVKAATTDPRAAVSITSQTTKLEMLDKLMVDINQLIDEIYKLRESLDPVPQNNA